GRRHSTPSCLPERNRQERGLPLLASNEKTTPDVARRLRAAGDRRIAGQAMSRRGAAAPRTAPHETLPRPPGGPPGASPGVRDVGELGDGKCPVTIRVRSDVPEV